MKVEEIETDNLIEYAFNNRVHSPGQVDRIANSILEFGFTQPIVIDEDNVVLVGHGRLAAAKKLSLTKVPVVQLSDLSETQKRAYRILDNKLQNDSEWNYDNLKIEMDLLAQADYPVDDWGLTDLTAMLIEGQAEAASGLEGDKYTKKIEAPIYEPTGEKPDVRSLFDTAKSKSLAERIKACNELTKEEREFLEHAAQRHTVFDYQKIAEFYAHAPAHVQELMEESALVIIDFNKAIEAGFVKLTEDLAEVYRNDVG